MLLEQRPELTPDQVKHLLTSTAQTIDANRENQGAGIVDLAATLQAPAPGVEAVQTHSPALGGGSLETARGSFHVGEEGDQLIGEMTAFGDHFNSPARRTGHRHHLDRIDLVRIHLVRRHLVRQHLVREHLERFHLVPWDLERRHLVRIHLVRWNLVRIHLERVHLVRWHLERFDLVWQRLGLTHNEPPKQVEAAPGQQPGRCGASPRPKNHQNSSASTPLAMTAFMSGAELPADDHDQGRNRPSDRPTLSNPDSTAPKPLEPGWINSSLEPHINLPIMLVRRPSRPPEGGTYRALSFARRLGASVTVRDRLHAGAGCANLGLWPNSTMS